MTTTIDAKTPHLYAATVSNGGAGDHDEITLRLQILSITETPSTPMNYALANLSLIEQQGPLT